jgi:hypothetical protein
MNIATRIENVCTKVLNKRKQLSVERDSISNRSLFLKTAKKDRHNLSVYLEEMCAYENVNPKSIRRILS